MRVYELARVLDVTPRALISQLRSSGEWVQSHLSTIPDPVVRRLHPERPAPAKRPSPSTDREFNDLDRYLQDQLSAADDALEEPPARPSTRRRRGPATIRLIHQDELFEVEDLRSVEVVTVLDAASVLQVAPATIRRWAARGYIRAIGKIGPANLYDGASVLDTFHAVQRRRRATGQRTFSHYCADRLQVDRVATKHHDRIVSTSEAARLVGVSPATIRSWIHRGHLSPLPSGSITARLRLGDVVAAAHRRQLPSRRLGQPKLLDEILNT